MRSALPHRLCPEPLHPLQDLLLSKQAFLVSSSTRACIWSMLEYVNSSRLTATRFRGPSLMPLTPLLR